MAFGTRFLRSWVLGPSGSNPSYIHVPIEPIWLSYGPVPPSKEPFKGSFWVFGYLDPLGYRNPGPDLQELPPEGEPGTLGGSQKVDLPSDSSAKYVGSHKDRDIYGYRYAKSRSTLEFYNLHHRSIRVQNWGSILPHRALRLERHLFKHEPKSTDVCFWNTVNNWLLLLVGASFLWVSLEPYMIWVHIRATDFWKLPNIGKSSVGALLHQGMASSVLQADSRAELGGNSNKICRALQ